MFSSSASAPASGDQAGVLDPAARRRPVQRRDHRDRHGRLDPLELLQVLVGAEREASRLGEVGQRLGVRLARRLVGIDTWPARRRTICSSKSERMTIAARPRVLEAPHDVEVVGERRGARHERMRQVEAEVGRREVHGHLPPSAAAAAAGARPPTRASLRQVLVERQAAGRLRSTPRPTTASQRAGSAASTIRKRLSFAMNSLGRDLRRRPSRAAAARSPCARRRGSKR